MHAHTYTYMCMEVNNGNKSNSMKKIEKQNNPKVRCPWCNGYRRRKWTRRHEFKSWTRLIAFHIVLIPLGKVRIQLFSLQLWVKY